MSGSPAVSPLYAHAVTLTAVLAALWSSFETSVEPTRGLLLLAGLLYAALGTLGLRRLEASVPTRRQTAGYFGTMTALLIVMLELSGGHAWLAGLPLLSHAVLLMPVAWAAVGGVVFTVAIAWRYPVDQAKPVEVLTGVGALAFFVGGFSFVARREMEWRTRAEKLTARVVHANQQLKDYAERVADVSRSEERNRLAREVHDGLGHYLTSIFVQLEATAAVAASEGRPIPEGVVRAQRLAKEGLEEVRQSVAVMRSHERRGPALEDALRKLVDDVEDSLTAHLEMEGALSAVTPTLQHATLRIAQEALTNVRRHARAQLVRLRVEVDDDALRLHVEDDGQGAECKPTGWGLEGIRERVSHLGGECEFGPSPQGGFFVHVRLPR